MSRLEQAANWETKQEMCELSLKVILQGIEWTQEGIVSTGFRFQFVKRLEAFQVTFKKLSAIGKKYLDGRQSFLWEGKMMLLHISNSCCGCLEDLKNGIMYKRISFPYL